MKSFSAKKEDIQKKWVLIDAKDKVLGRVATRVASIIRGKTKPIFTPHMDTGDNVIIINASKVRLTGNKWLNKTYYWHTGYAGGIKSLTARELWQKKPTELLRKAIYGMLPKNRLGRILNDNVRIYESADHPHESQNPEQVSV